MRQQLLALLIIGILIVLVSMAHTTKEAFTTNPECPTSAVRGPDGSIIVKPGNRSFKTLSDYVGYLSNIYAKGADCIPPMVRPSREPIPGVFVGESGQSPSSYNLQGAEREVLNHTNDELTSAKTPINKLDDYEYTRVFQSESDKRNNLSATVKNELMQRNILDWANLPFNSEARAASEDEFVAGRLEKGFRDPKSGVFFTAMEGNNIQPPDVEAEKLREQKILASYRPTDITTHTIDSETEAVAKLVNQMYEKDKNWEPVVTKVDENRYEVSELRPRPRVEKYADTETMTVAMAESKGLLQPKPSISIVDRMRADPYFQQTGVADNDNDRFWNYKDFNQWTPGLERMFAPTSDKKDWY